MIRAAVWNVNHGSTAKDVRPKFREIRDTFQPHVLVLQEVKAHSGIVSMLSDEFGYGVIQAEPEFAVAWNPTVFSYLRHRRVLMSPIRYWTLNYALVVVLRDKRNGRKVKVMSYHPPAHVQAPGHVTNSKVLTVLHGVVRRWNRIARRSSAVCLFAGDDNVDERKGWTPGGGWGFVLHGPLTQVRAPKPTHGGRRIDDFRVRGLEPVGAGCVLDRGPSDHAPFLATFRYKENR